MSLLPGQILPESVPFGRVDRSGALFVDHNWYLFLYNLALLTLTPPGSAAPVPVSPSDLIDMADLDAAGTDVTSLAQVVSSLAQIAFDQSLQDSPAAAQPAQPVTVGASPFTYTALVNGTLAVSGPTMSSGSATVTSIALMRQGVTVATGAVSGPIPLRRGDKALLTFSTAPTVVFLPD